MPESQGLLQDYHDALQCVTKGRGICQKCLFRYSGKRFFMSCNESEITASIIYQCISYSKSLSSQHAFLTKRHVEMNPSRGSRGSDFLCSGRFSEPSCIHVCFAGMNFVFDKGHIAHKGIHDHFKSQVFVNKQG